jgi:hypothetical protein
MCHYLFEPNFCPRALVRLHGPIADDSFTESEELIGFEVMPRFDRVHETSVFKVRVERE